MSIRFLIPILFLSIFENLMLGNDCSINNNDIIHNHNANSLQIPIDHGNKNKLALLKAILLKKSDAVKTLLESGVSPNITYMDKPIIHWVIKNGELLIALNLINAGADFSGIIEEEQDVFTYVSTHFNIYVPGKSTQLDLDVLNALVLHGYNIQGNFQNANLRNNALYLIINNNLSNRVEYFLGWANSNFINPYPKLQAANPNQSFTLPDGSKWDALITAIERYDQNNNMPGGNISIIGSLLKAGADINKKVQINKKCTHTPLSLALTKNDAFLINYLIENGANVLEGIQLFIENGHNKNCAINSMWKGDWTLLGIAIHYQCKEAVNLLIYAKANINQIIDPYPIPKTSGLIQHYQKNGDSLAELRGPHTPLFYALKQNRDEIANLLIEHGAYI